MKLSKYFTLKEAIHSSTAERLGISNYPSPTDMLNIKMTAQKMDTIRELLGKPIIIYPYHSWYRSKDVNKAVGGSATSDHMSGKSVDFTSPRFGSVQQVCEAIAASNIQFDQLIFEQGKNSEWVHIGFGDKMRNQVMSWKSGVGYVNGIKKL